MSRQKIKFGTDGWRAVIAEEFTFANVDRVAQATAEHWKRSRPKGTRKKVVVGCDRRFLADQFAERVAEVFAGNGFRTQSNISTLSSSHRVGTRRQVRRLARLGAVENPNEDHVL